MYTENEAQKKWCPFSRTAIVEYAPGGETPTAAAATNRGSSGLISSCDRCIGQLCMAWRWVSQEEDLERVIRTRSSTQPDDRDHLPHDMDILKTMPGGKKWAMGKCAWDDEDGGWWTTWTRNNNPERKGYCGMAR